MRVISGTAKGHRLAAPKSMNIRPTPDRVKESVFNILGVDIEDARVLDLFAGTGALGIEALSRTAASAVFVDAALESIRLITKNLEATGLKDKAEIIKAEADKAVKRLAKEERKFDLIFLDPPYRISVSFLDAILCMLVSDLLDINGMLVLEHDAKREARMVSGLEVVSTRTYGDTAVTFYRKKGLS